MGAPNHNKGTLVGSAAMPGVGTLLGYQFDVGKQGQQDAQDAADAQAARLAQAQATRDRFLGQLNDLFGIGTSQSAQTNARTIQQSLQDYYTNTLQTGLNNADTQFANESRVTRQNLARMGQLDGGTAATAGSANLADYLRARSKALGDAASAKSALSSQLTNQRLNLAQAISSGQTANPDFTAAAAARDATLSGAQGSVVPSAIGQLFSDAGSAYYNGRVQGGYGNQGLSAFGFSSSNPGRVT